MRALRAASSPQFLLSIAAFAFAFLACSSANAEVVIGQLAPSNPVAECSEGPVDLVQAAVGMGSDYTVPVGGGLITSWSTNAAAGSGQTLKFKVYQAHPDGTETNYSVVAHDGPRALTPSVLNTFPTAIPVQAGDAIGLNDQNAASIPNACLTHGVVGDVWGGVDATDTPDGSIEPSPPVLIGEEKINVSATILQSPEIASLAPPLGSITGGFPVVISGSNFAEVKSVSFGEVPAASFAVDSESQITAVAPRGMPRDRVVLVNVETAAGATPGSSTEQFIYTACLVPRLKGKNLLPAKKKLRQGHCNLGRVKRQAGPAARKGKIVRQRPKPGGVLAPGTKVKVTLDA